MVAPRHGHEIENDVTTRFVTVSTNRDNDLYRLPVSRSTCIFITRTTRVELSSSVWWTEAEREISLAIASIESLNVSHLTDVRDERRAYENINNHDEQASCCPYVCDVGRKNTLISASCELSNQTSQCGAKIGHHMFIRMGIMDEH